MDINELISAAIYYCIYFNLQYLFILRYITPQFIFHFISALGKSINVYH